MLPPGGESQQGGRGRRFACRVLVGKGLKTRKEGDLLPHSIDFMHGQSAPKLLAPARSLYTSGFVLVKGYGEVQVDGDVPPAPAAAAEPGVELLERQREGQQRQQHASVDQPHLPHRALRAVQDIQEVQGEQVQGMSRCPFETSPLPLTAADIGSEPSMTSIYVHEATVNCLLWGLYNSGKLAFELRDGTVPGLTITTDVLALLVPELPTLYPHQRLNINVQVGGGRCGRRCGVSVGLGEGCGGRGRRERALRLMGRRSPRRTAVGELQLCALWLLCGCCFSRRRWTLPACPSPPPPAPRCPPGTAWRWWWPTTRWATPRWCAWRPTSPSAGRSTGTASPSVSARKGGRMRAAVMSTV